MKTIEIEVAIANHFDPIVNLIVPNVSWGFHIHECDLLIISKSGFLTEVEIKVSKADLIKDKQKLHNHSDRRIKHLYFAIPFELIKYKDLIPDRAGILAVVRQHIIYRSYSGDNKISQSSYYRAYEIRPAKKNKTEPISDTDRYNIARLGTMRIWSLKKKLLV